MCVGEEKEGEREREFARACTSRVGNANTANFVRFV